METNPKRNDKEQQNAPAPYPTNVFSEEVINKVGGYLTYLQTIGRKDISGDDWGDAFADAIGGKHKPSPASIADVIYDDKCCWSAKTVLVNNPFEAKRVRLISGRNSDIAAYNINDPYDDIQKTGDAVLNIWNERVDKAIQEHGPIRTTVLLRSRDLLTYRLFEEETQKYRTEDYHWELSQKKNFLGFDKNGKHCFSWCPKGSQFTIHAEIPEESAKFSIKSPKIFQKDDILKAVGFNDSWITKY